jgi:hypothetical protein
MEQLDSLLGDAVSPEQPAVLVEETSTESIAPRPSAAYDVLPLLLEFSNQARTLQSHHELPSIMARSAARIAPRALIFARRGSELVGWDGFMGERQFGELRGTRLDLRGLQDLAKSLEHGETFSYAGHLDPFYSQLPEELGGEVAQSCFVPVSVEDQCIGVLCADIPGSGDRFDQIPLELLARHAGLIMERLSRLPHAGAVAATKARAAELPAAEVEESRPGALVQTSTSGPTRAEELAVAEPVGATVGGDLPFHGGATAGTPAFVQAQASNRFADPELASSVYAAAPISDSEGIDSTKAEPVDKHPSPGDETLRQSASESQFETDSQSHGDSIESEMAVRPADSSDQSLPTVELPAGTVPDQEIEAQRARSPFGAAPEQTTPAGTSSTNGELVWDLGEDGVEIEFDSNASDEPLASFHVDVPDQDPGVTRLLDRSRRSGEKQFSEEEEAARTLARVIVQDIALYNANKIEHGVAGGNVADLMLDDILKGAAHYKSKVSASVLGKRFFREALVDLLARGRPELLRTLNLEC